MTRKTQEARPMKDDQRKRQRAEVEAELAGLRDRLAMGADAEGVA